MLIFCPISSLGDAYKRFLSDAYKKNMYTRCLSFGSQSDINTFRFTNKLILILLLVDYMPSFISVPHMFKVDYYS